MDKKSLNKHLHKANVEKNDEFYTQLTDIEKELKHYKEHFKGKIVYCNCDDPYESNFFKFFASNFNNFKLKKLIVTSYSGSPIVGSQLPLFDIKGLKDNSKEPFKIEINKVEDSNKDGSIDMSDVELLLKYNENTVTPLKQGGDFRSKECIDLLKQSDIVCTNPPFSLFREYVAQLIGYDKKFLIIGNQNALTNKDIFNLIKNNKIWLGIDNGGTKWFKVPEHYDITTESRKKIEDGVKFFSLGTIVWLTNLDNKKRHESLNLYKKYSSKEYLAYKNYKAINVDKVSDIPIDYKGVMGVPLTFLDKYNPNQFEIIGQTHSGDKSPEVEILRKDKEHRHRGIVEGEDKEKYVRILIKNKKV